jgi:hypothetical protein
MQKEIKNPCQEDWRKETLRRSSDRWKDNIKMCIREIWLEGVDWIKLDQNRER